ncbi:MAG TPA: cytosine permease [Gaiellaceae bacterium]|jgi:putative hydroxymethylpyrimidine transporter CytX|nr:cytosine permease [Gaiellaceae bacterium]
MDDRAPAWGIDPVPERLRTLGLWDLTVLWGNLGVSLLVLVIGALLVPALTLRDALLAILVGGVIGNAMVGTAGMIGANARVPSMVLLRAPLGRRGSYIPTTLNALQCLGWATFELIIIAAAASALSDEVFGIEAKTAWTIGFGALAAAFALLGPVGFVRRILRRFGVWIVLGSLVYLTWWALSEADIGALWDAPAQGGSTFWLGVDLVIAITVSWVPLVSDYTRFSKERTQAFWGSGGGYFIGGTWMLALGIFIVLSRGVSDPVEIPPAVAAAGFAAALALLAVTIDETDEAFANIYSTAVSLQNVAPAVEQRVLIAAVALVSTIGALLIELRNYESFLLLLGSFFVPLFGVLLADWLVSGARYTSAQIFNAPAWRPELLAAWLLGFLLYHWLHEPPLGPSWWVDIVEQTDQPNLGIGASLPSFAASFVLALGLGSLASRLPQPASKW